MLRDEIKKNLEELGSGWELVDTKKIRKDFEFKSFMDSIAFINKVAELAEEEGHHPDMFIYYKKVSLELWTHAIKGLHENDFIMAAKIEQI